MPKDPADQEVANAIGRAIESDEQLQAAARLLAERALSRAMYYLEYGSPLVQMQIIRTLMPAVGRALVMKADENEEMDQLRQSLAAIHQAALE